MVVVRVLADWRIGCGLRYARMRSGALTKVVMVLRARRVKADARLVVRWFHGGWILVFCCILELVLVMLRPVE